MDELKKLELVNEMLTLSAKKGVTAECIVTAINLANQHSLESFASIIARTLDIWDCFPEAVSMPSKNLSS